MGRAITPHTRSPAVMALELAGYVRRARPPLDVSGVAQAAGVEALDGALRDRARLRLSAGQFFHVSSTQAPSEQGSARDQLWMLVFEIVLPMPVSANFTKPAAVHGT